MTTHLLIFCYSPVHSYRDKPCPQQATDSIRQRLTQDLPSRSFWTDEMRKANANTRNIPANVRWMSVDRESY